MEYSKEQILRLADSLEVCADPERGCGECMFDKTCDRGQENGGAILKEAAKVIRAQADLLNYQETVIGHLKEALAGPEGTAVRSLGCARDDKAMMSADREEDAGEGQAWQMGLYERAIEKWGELAQIVKAMEEMDELGAELARALIADEWDDHLLSHIKEELADVCIMTDQLQLIFGDVSDWEMYKLERLERKLVKGL